MIYTACDLLLLYKYTIKTYCDQYYSTKTQNLYFFIFILQYKI